MRQQDWSEHYNSTLYRISHDLGAPLRHVVAFSELLQDEQNLDSTDAQKWLEIICSAGKLAQGMLDGLVRLSRVLSSEPVLTDLSLAQQLAPFNFQDIPDQTVRADNGLLSTAIAELCANADLYGGGSRNHVAHSGAWVDLRFSNLQPTNVTPQQWQNALQPLDRMGQKSDIEHIGVGLPIAVGIATMHAGELLFEDQTVILRLPATIRTH